MGTEKKKKKKKKNVVENLRLIVDDKERGGLRGGRCTEAEVVVGGRLLSDRER